MSAFQGLTLELDAGRDVLSTSPRGSDTETPRTWTGPPSRAASCEPQAALIAEQHLLRDARERLLQHQGQQRDVVDVRCAAP